MSNKIYVDKYLKLLKKLTSYLVANGKELKKLPKDASYVAFSAKDTGLNKMNLKILDELKKEKKPVIKAEEPASQKDPWKFTVISQ